MVRGHLLIITKKAVMPMKALITAAFVLLFAMSAHAATTWLKAAENIDKALDHAAATYEAGKAAQAAEEVADAYFGLFESEDANMEIAVRRYISGKRAVELENGFNGLRKAMSKGTPANEVRRQAKGLGEGVRKAAGELDSKGIKVSSGVSQ